MTPIIACTDKSQEYSNESEVNCFHILKHMKTHFRNVNIRGYNDHC